MDYLHVILHALKHTALILPLLFIIYYLIELIEFKWAVKIQNNRLLKGKAGPVFGSALGCVPQCGFSVISSDLFSKRAISVGTLIAVFIATSDEALPIMFANPKAIGWVALLIAVKFVFGLAVGYLAILLHKIIFKKPKIANLEKLHHEDHSHEEHQHHEDHDHEHENEVVGAIHGGCCHHDVDTKSFDWLHPLKHCIKIGLFILAVNIAFGFVTDVWVGEDNLTKFLSNSSYIQPLLAILIGLIPNCASSVVLTELFLVGGLSFGALAAGLSVNAGLGLIILFKQNKNAKENIFITLMLIIPSLILGYCLNFIFL